jgi:hypothetical protein
LRANTSKDKTMKTVTATIETVKLDLAEGQTLGGWRFGLTDPSGTITTQDLDVPVILIALTVAGDYTITGQRLDSTGALFGDQVSGVFTIPVPEQGDAASSITVTLV